MCIKQRTYSKGSLLNEVVDIFAYWTGIWKRERRKDTNNTRKGDNEIYKGKDAYIYFDRHSMFFFTQRTREYIQTECIEFLSL